MYYEDFEKFETDTSCVSFMEKNFVENDLPLTVFEGIKEKKYTTYHLYCKKNEKDEVVVMCIQTPPYDLIVCHSPFSEEIVKLHLKDIIEEVRKRTPKLTGLLGEKRTAEIFAECWCEEMKAKKRVEMNQRVFEADASTLKEPERELEDEISYSYCEEEDERVLELIEEAREIFHSHNTAKKLLQTNQYHYVELKDKSIATICSTRGYLTLPMGRVSYVYTPKKHRRKGYATWNVYEVCRKKIFDEKKFKKIVLHTDLSNPTSNSIYQKIGFKPKVDYIWLKFEY